MGMPVGREWAMPQRNDLRAHREELQRVQIGLVGLAAVLLIVTLANLVVQKVRTEAIDATAAAEAIKPVQVSNSPAADNEPLADLGVTPTADTAAPSVPDLEPDPRLRERMDRDPNQPAN
jgi:type IV secretory pathway VirB10-like protein